MEQNPREALEEMVRKGDLKGILEKVTEFHGHYCHKVVYGMKAGLLALKEQGIEAPSREALGGVVVIAECTGPFCNGVQIATGTSIGTDNFVIDDQGKLALTLLRNDNLAVRVAVRTDFLGDFTKRNPELAALFGGSYATIPVPEDMKTPLTQMGLIELFTKQMGITDMAQMQEMMGKMMETHASVVLKELDVKDGEMFKVERKSLDFSKYAPI